MSSYMGGAVLVYGTRDVLVHLLVCRMLVVRAATANAASVLTGLGIGANKFLSIPLS